MTENSKIIRQDGWDNIYKGFGGRQDVTKDTSFGDFKVVSDLELASMFAGDGWVKKLIKAPADDMTRAWISLSDDGDSDILKQLKKLKAKAAFNTAISWARLFRGGVIWMVSSKPREKPYKDGEKLDIRQLKVFSASQIKVIKWEDGKSDPSRYGEPVLFEVTPGGNQNNSFKVHATQCLIIKGDPIPVVTDPGFTSMFSTGTVDEEEYMYWGTGVVQSIYNQLSRYGTFEQGMGNLGTEIIVAIYKIAGLREILQSENGAEIMANRMETMNQAKSILNAVFLDSEGDEDFFRNTPQLAGVPELWDKFMMVLSGVTNIPASRLFGRQASGLNNKGEMDERNYNAYLTGQQELQMEGVLTTLLKHMTGKEVSFDFNNPWEPSVQEANSMRGEQAKTDKIYLELGVLLPEEVRNSRFTGEYSFETELLDGVFDPNAIGPYPIEEEEEIIKQKEESDESV